ncbi:uncharacterized protein LOC143186490 [Calliopsis andreniformis]|uniref:uncharacterized protein LOC143186490 n=1 Tax=Calliopsis andreniformis TaxID=337506 RepID=UPI003FCE46AB
MTLRLTAHVLRRPGGGGRSHKTMSFVRDLYKFAQFSHSRSNTRLESLANAGRSPRLSIALRPSTPSYPTAPPASPATYLEEKLFEQIEQETDQKDSRPDSPSKEMFPILYFDFDQ